MRLTWITGACLLLMLSACGQQARESAQPVVNVYNWFDYIKPELLRRFEARTGIRVQYNTYDSNNTLTSRLLAGHSGYDVVFPSAANLQTLTGAGVFRRLDRSQLPNWVNLDPALMARLAAQDPGNAHAALYTWGITGLAYDAARVRALLPAAPVDSWAMLFDPGVVRQLAACGVGLYESPNVIVPSVLAWLRLPPNSENPQDLERAATALMAVRPYIRKISSGSLVDDLASGELCVIIASNGDAMQAQERVRIAAGNADIRYSIPSEGAVMWFDVAAIPADAPHAGNALRFLNFLLDAAVAAENSNAIRFPNGNAAAQSAMAPELANRAIFPGPELASRLFTESAKSEDYVRQRTRVWTRFRTGH